MKVATLTFHRALNYGSAMQSFALWRAIADLGHDVEIIDFIPEGQEDLYRVYSKIDSPRAILRNARALPFASRLAARRDSFTVFLKEKTKLSSQSCIGRIDDELLASFDVVVAGSDQIWNPNAHDFSLEYLLPRGDSFRRVAYAPSLNGASLASVEGADDCLRRFDFLSAREASGVREIEYVVGDDRPVETVLDPTLLLDADAFRTVESASDVPESFIFLYSVTYRRAVIDYAISLSAKTGYPVIAMFTTDRTYEAMRVTKGKVSFFDYASPGDFIRLIDKASYVVTNSFHGTVFSVLFGKPFAVVRSMMNGALFHDHRVDNFLEQVKLQDCVVEEGAFPDALPLDYDRAAVSGRLVSLRKGSLDYLREALS